ncbi:MAG: DMT family transporter [Clostridiales bacterium]|nr:DMT family transporter [Clostridiales bacterium]
MARPLIVLATLIWGSSFVVMKNTLDDVPVFFLLGVRFTIAAVILALVFHKRWASVDRHYVAGGALMGILLFLAYAFQTFGLEGTTPGKNAFLTAVYCVLVPFLYWAVAGKRPDRYNMLAALLCIVGIGLVSLTRDLTITWGDGLTLVCCIFYAAHIVAVPRIATDRDIFLLTVIQFATTAALSWVCALATRGVPARMLPMNAVGGLLYLSVAATALALLCQNVGQKYTSATSASVLLSLEAPFGVLFSILFYRERPSVSMLLGFALIFAAVLCSETKFQFPAKKGVDKLDSQHI